MLAVLGLLSLAFAGTALVGVVGADSGADDAIPDNEQPQTDDQAPSILDLIETDIVEDTTNGFEMLLNDLIGSDGIDELFGTNGDDTIAGLDGLDYIDGAGGDDDIFGGDDADQLHGGAGNDLVDGGQGEDLLYGHIGDDDLSGGSGNDKLHGGDGADLIDGGDDNDELLGGHGDDTLIGGAGQDVLQGSGGNDVIDGVTGEATAQKDYLNGGRGDDTLIGNDTDVMSGGDGADTFHLTDGVVSIMDYSPEDTLVLDYEGAEPVLSTEANDTGLTLLADGMPIANLFGVSSFDVSTVQLVAS